MPAPTRSRLRTLRSVSSYSTRFSFWQSATVRVRGASCAFESRDGIVEIGRAIGRDVFAQSIFERAEFFAANQPPCTKGARRQYRIVLGNSGEESGINIAGRQTGQGHLRKNDQTSHYLQNFSRACLQSDVDACPAPHCCTSMLLSRASCVVSSTATLSRSHDVAGRLQSQIAFDLDGPLVESGGCPGCGFFRVGR